MAARPGAKSRALALVFAIAAISACGSGEPGPKIVDDTGAVQEWRFLLADELYDQLDNPISDEDAAAVDRSGAVALSPPVGWDLRIAWYAASCMTAPIVQVTGAAEKIAAIAVDYGPEVKGRGACGDSLSLHAVDMKTSAAVSPDLSVSGVGEL